jgi:hypothetical protein
MTVGSTDERNWNSEEYFLLILVGLRDYLSSFALVLSLIIAHLISLVSKLLSVPPEHEILSDLV